jgi:hypothetical protein
MSKEETEQADKDLNKWWSELSMVDKSQIQNFVSHMSSSDSVKAANKNLADIERERCMKNFKHDQEKAQITTRPSKEVVTVEIDPVEPS